MKTAVVILNWNTRKYLSSFLPPLIDSLTGLDAELIVADNASCDDSLEFLNREFPSVKTLAFEENLGFTGGYNKAISVLSESPDKPEYVVLINSDVKVSQAWLQPLVEYLDGHPECGVCGPKLLQLQRQGEEFVESKYFEYAGAAGGCLDLYGYPFCHGRVLGRVEKDEGQYDRIREVFWISGACMAVRLSLWEKIQGLDSRFFAHMEEIDFCWRTQLSGYRVVRIPQSKVWHLGGGSLPQGSEFKLKLNFRNSLLMLDNNLAASVGKRRALRLMLKRRLMDFCIAILYLLSGKIKFMKAVRAGYREYKELRHLRAHSVETASCTLPPGMYPFSIILKTGLKGRHIFEYLRNYDKKIHYPTA